MKNGMTKKTLIVLLLGVAILIGVSWQINDPKIGQALLAGYVLFALNYILLARIYAGVMLIAQGGEASSRLKTGVMLGTAVKFVGLIAAMYVLIVVWELPGLYLAMGSLISLVLLTSLLLSSYIKSMGSSSPS